jgi:hypothetical protein
MMSSLASGVPASAVGVLVGPFLVFSVGSVSATATASAESEMVINAGLSCCQVVWYFHPRASSIAFCRAGQLSSANHDLLAASFPFHGQMQKSLRALARLVSLVTLMKVSYELDYNIYQDSVISMGFEG